MLLDVAICSGAMNSETVYDFQWNPDKALYNARKHGVTFDQAATVFLDALTLTVYDEANSQNEDRWFTLGYDANGRLLALAHTFEMVGPTNIRVRIISARKATKRERRCYENEPR
jgi:uncharacterized DUF497 family protein